MTENLKPKEPRLTIIAFLECELRGSWEDWIDEAVNKQGLLPEEMDLTLGTKAAENYRAGKECELWVVRQDNLRRAFVFKEHSIITISGTTVKFSQNSILEELSINENTR